MERVKSVHSAIGTSSHLYNDHSGMGRVKSVHSRIGEPFLTPVCAQWDRPAILICKMAQWDGESKKCAQWDR